MEPFFMLECAWEGQTLPDKENFERYDSNNQRQKGPVTPDYGNYGVEYTLAITLTEFQDMQKAFQYTGAAIFRELRKCLKSNRQVAWDNLVTSDYPNESGRNATSWKTAINKWLKKITQCDKPRDVQLRYLADRFACKKDLHKDCAEHHLRWEQVLNNSLMLPSGNQPDPTDEIKKEWYYLTYCKQHRMK